MPMEQLRQLFVALDYVGVGVFALTGAMVAARNRQDLITCIFFAGMTGLGGGTIRDLLIGVPVFWLDENGFMLVCLAAGFLVWFARERALPSHPLRWMDALGLSSYSAFGALKAISYGVPPLPALLMGVVTATFGGVLRDIVAGQPSVLMQRDVYVTAAIAGAGTTVLCVMLGLHLWIAGFIGALVALFLRGGAILWGWKLPIHPGL